MCTAPTLLPLFKTTSMNILILMLYRLFNFLLVFHPQAPLLEAALREAARLQSARSLGGQVLHEMRLKQ